MNKIAEQQNQLKRRFGSLTSKWKPVSKQEFQTLIALFTTAASLGPKGKSLFRKVTPDHQLLFSCPLQFNRFMSLKRFKEICAHAFYVFADIEAKNKRNKWWPVLKIKKLMVTSERNSLRTKTSNGLQMKV